jgi:hypothetical protein
MTSSYNGWYKINVELDLADKVRFIVTQCYPNGEEYVLSNNERRQLPLYLKVFCIGISEEVLKDRLASMTFDEDGIRM